MTVDAVIVGSGPGGSTAADVLTSAGWSVIVFEKGRNHLIDPGDPARLASDYSNDEIKFLVRHFLGPDPLLEPRSFRSSVEDGDRIHYGHLHPVPSTVGGGGPHADGKLPRFREQDFRLLSELGPVEGAEVDDWPLQYGDLEAYYADAERLAGVAGQAGANVFESWRSGPYPMPPGAPMYGAVLSTEAAGKLGLHPYPAPTGANSVPYDGRPACNNCGFCGFFGCPIHAKGDPVAMLRRALLTGRCELRPETFVSRVLHRNGRASGVEYVTSDGTVRTEAARHVLLAGGAVETPRLLLLSGFSNPLIGRRFMTHFQTITVGVMPFSLHGHKGRSVTHLHDDHIVGNAESKAAAREAGLPWIRGGIVEHGAGGHPVMEAKGYPPGRAHKKLMRNSPVRDKLWAFTMQGEDLPQATNRIDLDPSIRDVRGFPVARITYRSHHHELVASRHHRKTLEAVLGEMGSVWTRSSTSPNPKGRFSDYLSPASASYHVMGTTRMGANPSSSVVDPFGRLHEAPNVSVVDSSVFVTSAGYGPTLTLIALAIRASRSLVP